MALPVLCVNYVYMYTRLVQQATTDEKQENTFVFFGETMYFFLSREYKMSTEQIAPYDGCQTWRVGQLQANS